MTTKTTTMKPETKPEKKIFQPPPVMTQPNNPPIMMEHCKEFIASEMAIFRTRLKKLSNVPMPSAANSNIVNHPTPTQPLTVPSPLTTSSEGFITGEMVILQAKLKKSFALDMADIVCT